MTAHFAAFSRMPNSKASNGASDRVGAKHLTRSRRARVILLVIIFVTAFGVRVLSWHDTRLEVGKVQTVVAGDYKLVARMLRAGGVASFLSSPPPVEDVNALLAHPPGYSILISLIYSVFGESDTALQFVQIVFDGLAVEDYL